MKLRLVICFFLLFSSISFAGKNINLKENLVMPEVIIDGLTVFEYDGTITVPIRIDAPDSVDTVINITTMDGTAVSPNDYTAVTTTVTIPAGQTSVAVMVYIVHDGISEISLESFTVNGTVISGNTSNSNASGIVYIVDVDDAALGIGNVTVNENDGVASVPVTVGTNIVDTVVQITTVDNSATSPDDYTTTTATVTIPALQNTAFVNIPITADNIGEPTEDFTVSGAVISGNTINSDASGTITIIDDDTPIMSVGNVTVNENDGNANVAISISNPSSVDTYINVNTDDNTAINPDDYLSNYTTVIIPANEVTTNVSISITNDFTNESIENFWLTGTVLTGNTQNPIDTGTITITDDDTCTTDGANDCDGDGVTNGDELNPQNGGTPTNPNDPCDFNANDITLTQTIYLSADCDGDGVINGDELNPLNGGTATDPTDSCDFNVGDITLAQSGDYLTSDCDDDGVFNGDELNPPNGGTPTDPNNSCSFNLYDISYFSQGSLFWMDDCDGDGITNGNEIDSNSDGILDQSTTDPLNPCDPMLNVGYTGFDEENPVWQAADCDGDNQNNALELILGSDPYDPNFNIIEGTVMFDSDVDGCDANDTVFSYTKINISDGIITEVVFTNEFGDYSYYAGTGAHVITPDLENPTFFTVTPQIAITNFPSLDNIVFSKDFCITSNGVNPDVEIVIAPDGAARPGFNANYVITYVNKGNQTVSGVVDFIYDDAVLDFVNSSQMPTTQSTGTLSWNYTDLAPFESRSINVILNVNSPMETPPVNNGDQLVFNATINPIAGDILPDDNQFSFTQTVVGSYDPNDITCVEGSNVDPDEIGEYLHYIINFENTGTFFAENIVVEMDIDPAQFDISTLRLLSSSHNASVTIVGTTVRFIFQNIFLPVDGQGNLLLKIKSLNSLVENDIVSNDARIFFDYNFPIQTNNAETTFAILSNPEFQADSSITIYPNPTKNNIYITATTTIKSIVLYDLQGRMLTQTNYNTKNVNFDISNKAAGIYFIKIKTDTGIKTQKVVKM